MTPTTGEKLSFSLCKPCFKNGVRIQHLSIWASQMIRQWQRQGYQTKEKEVGRACWNIPVAYWKFLWLTTFCPWRTFAHVLRSLNFGLTWCSAKVKNQFITVWSKSTLRGCELLHQRKSIVAVKMIYGSKQFAFESRLSCTILLKTRNAF